MNDRNKNKDPIVCTHHTPATHLTHIKKNKIDQCYCTRHV